MRHADRRAAGQHDIALAAPQTLGRQVNGDQGRRARRLHGHARPCQPKLVADTRREKVLVTRNVGLVRVGRHVIVVVRQPEVIQQIGIESAARIDPDARVIASRRDAGAFERLPRHLEEEPLLRIEQLGFMRRVAEKAGIELVDIGKNRARFDVGRIFEQRPGHHGSEVCVVEKTHRFDATTKVGEEFLGRIRARKAAGHSDDGNGLYR